MNGNSSSKQRESVYQQMHQAYTTLIGSYCSLFGLQREDLFRRAGCLEVDLMTRFSLGEAGFPTGIDLQRVFSLTQIYSTFGNMVPIPPQEFDPYPAMTQSPSDEQRRLAESLGKFAWFCLETTRRRG